MGLFNRKKKKNDYDPRKSFVPEITYDDDLATTLLNAIGIGSRDVKKVDLTYDDDVVSYIFDSGILKSVESENKPLELFQRFYWADKNKYDENVLEKIAELSQTHKIPGFYAVIKQDFSDYLPLINEILYNYSVNILMENADKKINSLNMDILLGAAEHSIYNLDYLHLDSQTLDKTIKGFFTKEKYDLEKLTLSTLDATTLGLKAEFDAEDDNDRIIYAAAESNSNLQDLKELSEGFVFSTLLSRINQLVEKEIIEVDDPVVNVVIPEDDELPEFFDDDVDDNEPEKENESITEEIGSEVNTSENLLPDFETIENSDEEPILQTTPASISSTMTNTTPSLPTSKEESIENLSSNDQEESAFANPLDTAENDWSFSAPSHNDSDDGDFSYEEFGQEESDITEHVLDGFESYGKIILSQNNVSKEIIKEVSELLRKNEALEKETFNLDGEISDVQDEYEQTFHKFQYTAVDKEFNENEQITEDYLDEMRTKSNQVFEELYELEQERLIIGKDRKKVLKELRKIFSHFENGNVQEVVYKIEQKLDAIDNVVNKALHTTKDDEELLENAAISVIKPEEKEFDITQTPLFHKIASQQGNPFPINEKIGNV